jgi:hypothetical protein
MHPIVDNILTDWRVRAGDAPLSGFVPALRDGSATLPEPTRQVFVYLPWRALGLAKSIIDARPVAGLVPAAELARKSFFSLSALSASAAVSDPGWRFDAVRGVVVTRQGARLPVHELAEVRLDARGGVDTRARTIHAGGPVCVVELAHVGLRVLMDRASYDSVLAQLLLLARPDPAYFELMLYRRGGVVYRVKP